MTTQTPDTKPHLRPPQLEDLPALRPILEYWMKDADTKKVDPAEVDDVEQFITDGIEGKRSQRFLVAEMDGELLGIMGILDPSAGLAKHTSTDKPIEVTTALIAPSARHHGIGSDLLAGLSDMARENGATELVVASSQKYEQTGWPFWTKHFGEPVAVEVGYLKPGLDSQVWVKPLEDKKP